MSLLDDRKKAAELKLKSETEARERARIARQRSRRERNLDTAIILARRKLFGLAWDVVPLKDHQLAALAEVLNALPEDKRGKNWDVVKDFLTAPGMQLTAEEADLGSYRPSRLDRKADNLDTAE